MMALALRIPQARLFFMSMIVGRPAPAEMATAMVREGVPEGEAIATANKKGDAIERRRKLYGKPKSR